jgi:hypothetical protein
VLVSKRVIGGKEVEDSFKGDFGPPSKFFLLSEHNINSFLEVHSLEHDTINLIKNKLDEYGFTIYKHHKLENDQYVFFCENMVVFALPKEHTLSISFQATIRPDDAAQNVLILNEIPDITIDIMESFIYSEENKLLCGDQAFELIKNSMENNAVNEYKTKEMYSYLLNNVAGYEC